MIIAQVSLFQHPQPPFPLLCAHKREDLQVQKGHSSMVLSRFERGSCVPCFLSTLFLSSSGVRARWKSGVPPPSVPIQTSAWQRPGAFSPRQNTGLLCAIPSQMVSLFDRVWLLHAAAVGAGGGGGGGVGVQAEICGLLCWLKWDWTCHLTRASPS